MVSVTVSHADLKGPLRIVAYQGQFYIWCPGIEGPGILAGTYDDATWLLGQLTKEIRTAWLNRVIASRGQLGWSPVPPPEIVPELLHEIAEGIGLLIAVLFCPPIFALVPSF